MSDVERHLESFRKSGKYADSDFIGRVKALTDYASDNPPVVDLLRSLVAAHDKWQEETDAHAKERIDQFLAKIDGHAKEPYNEEETASLSGHMTACTPTKCHERCPRIHTAQGS